MKAVKAVPEEKYDVWANDGKRVSHGHSQRAAEAVAKAEHARDGRSYFVRPAEKRDTKFVLSPPKESATPPKETAAESSQKKRWLLKVLAYLIVVAAGTAVGRAIYAMILE